MPKFHWFELPASAAGRALLITILYSTLALIALYAPIASDSPLAWLFGTKAVARQVAVAFVEALFWPVVALIGYTIAEPWIALTRSRQR